MHVHSQRMIHCFGNKLLISCEPQSLQSTRCHGDDVTLGGQELTDCMEGLRHGNHLMIQL